MSLYDIRHKVEQKYKKGDDWIYAESKKAEIEIIKALIEICDSQIDEIVELEQQVEVVDPWEAYRKAMYQLQEAKNLEMGMRTGIIEYRAVMNQLNEATKKLRECEAYMDSMHAQIKEKNA